MGVYGLKAPVRPSLCTPFFNEAAWLATIGHFTLAANLLGR